jgi:hypothetical protein
MKARASSSADRGGRDRLHLRLCRGRWTRGVARQVPSLQRAAARLRRRRELVHRDAGAHRPANCRRHRRPRQPWARVPALQPRQGRSTRPRGADEPSQPRGGGAPAREAAQTMARAETVDTTASATTLVGGAAHSFASTLPREFVNAQGGPRDRLSSRSRPPHAAHGRLSFAPHPFRYPIAHRRPASKGRLLSTPTCPEPDVAPPPPRP